jgi:hypothetical protein
MLPGIRAALRAGDRRRIAAQLGVSVDELGALVGQDRARRRAAAQAAAAPVVPISRATGRGRRERFFPRGGVARRGIFRTTR